MEWYAFLALAFGLLLALFAAGLPIFLGFLALNVAALVWMVGPKALLLIVNSMYDTSTTFSLTTIPMFILLGEILFRTGSVSILFTAVDKVVGDFKARLFTVSVILSTIFGALSGSAMSVSAMMGSSLLPEMEGRGYNQRLSMGAILAGASLAPIIPPSVLAIIVGMLSGVSIAKLLIAGVLPGLMFATFFFSYLIVRARLDPAAAPHSPFQTIPWREKLGSVAAASPFLVIIALILGLIIGGIATPTESAAVGVIGAMIITGAIGKLTLTSLLEAVGSTAKITAMIMIIMACSMSYSQVLSFSGASAALVEAVTAMEIGYWPMFFVLMLLPFILCMFIDQIALMLLIIPIYLPIVDLFGFNPIWFWLIFLINISIGGITPPFGYTLFALKGVAPHVPMHNIFASVVPFIVLFLAGMAVLALFPSVVTFLPSLL